MDYEAVELLEQEAAERGRRRLFIWSALLALGWVIYELTAQPNLGVVTIGERDWMYLTEIACHDMRRLDGFGNK